MEKIAINAFTIIAKATNGKTQKPNYASPNRNLIAKNAAKKSSGSKTRSINGDLKTLTEPLTNAKASPQPSQKLHRCQNPIITHQPTTLFG